MENSRVNTLNVIQSTKIIIHFFPLTAKALIGYLVMFIQQRLKILNTKERGAKPSLIWVADKIISILIV